MAMKYGSKDLVRMEDIRTKSYGDWLDEMSLAKRMADLITQPGKAQARGYAAQEVFGDLSPHAAIFFQRAFELGGSNVYAEASVTSIEDVESAYEDMVESEKPASQRKVLETFKRKKSIRPTPIQSMGKVNLIKGTGPEFSTHEVSHLGVLEVWKSPDAKLAKLIWTSSNEPNYNIGEKQGFLYEGKRVEWEMIDYIDTVDIGNLVPLYGKNLPIYSYF